MNEGTSQGPAGACFSNKLSLAPDLGWVKASTQDPSEVRRDLAPKQGVWVLVSLWHRDLFILLISGHN